jgi:hypothetical protein
VEILAPRRTFVRKPLAVWVRDSWIIREPPHPLVGGPPLVLSSAGAGRVRGSPSVSYGGDFDCVLPTQESSRQA